jgi:hypothetical protein
MDCFIKLEGDYYPFLTGPMHEGSSERVIDRLEKAVSRDPSPSRDH